MKRTAGRLFFVTVFAQGFVQNVLAQTASIQVLQTIDSTKSANGARFSGKFVNAVTPQQGAAIQAGAAAVLTLNETSLAGVNTWVLTLVSPVAGKAVSIGAAVGTVAGRVGSQLGGLGLGGFGGSRKAAPAAANNTVSTGGTSVYIPANTQVRFVLDQPATTTAAPAPAQASPAVGQAQPAAVPMAQPSAMPASPATASRIGAPAGAPASTGTAQTGPSTVVWGNVQYVLQGCQRQPPHITCQVQITNLGAGDVRLSTNRNTYFIDQAGDRIGLAGASVANCNLFAGCLAVSGLPMAGSYVFVDQDSKANQLIRLEIVTHAGPVQFTNVTVQ